VTQKLFNAEFIQAVNDWQRGGDHHQKVQRGMRLKACATNLPARYRECNVACFRQEAHEKDRTWQLLADNRLPETIAAWTTDLQVAKALKGGVPPPGMQGVIFRLVPPLGSVVLNLAQLYVDPDFLDAVETHRRDIVGFHDGIGRWRGSQSEVVLELGSLQPAEVYSYGGFSLNREALAEISLQRKPTPEDLAKFDALSAEAGVAPGPRWLSQIGTQVVLKRIEPHLERLRERKRREQSADRCPI
jgi:hypothetical protein